ncbi:MAG TPA: tetraacyldisaccharide 4'-kinase [Candidatus Dormibacteraeota bacterium]|nr:tetraacyldisaccharide 4'-kinase [Candidatus Dormibacteraeota bacterium]
MNPEKLPSRLLWPLTFPYGAITRLRASLYQAGILRQRRLDGVVISVGNMTVGGTGKTPMVQWIAQRLIGEGKRCAILTRGYRGEMSAEGNTSDEARLLRARLGERVEIGVGADRFASGRLLAKRGAEWFVLDDGFQHMQLARDVDIVQIDATNPFGGRLLPMGRRREPHSALGRADVIVIMRSEHAPAVEGAVRRDSSAPIFYARSELDSIRKMTKGGSRSADTDVDFAQVRTRKLFAFCGIGNPGAFLADLRRWNLQIAGHKVFPDHHRYQQADFDALALEARTAGADALVCTEKDTFNLARVRSDAMDVLYCVISVCVDREDEFWRTVIKTAGERCATRARSTQ